MISRNINISHSEFDLKNFDILDPSGGMTLIKVGNSYFIHLINKGEYAGPFTSAELYENIPNFPHYIKGWPDIVSKELFAVEDEDFLTAIGNVVVLSDSGVTLFTHTLSWDNLKEKVFTDDRVIFITEEQDTLYGIGFESDVELNNWKILKPTGVFHEDEEK